MKKITLISYFLFSFRGRINRRQWWAVQLLLILPVLLGLNYYTQNFADEYEWADFLAITFLLVVIYINLSVCAKRYHDIDETGWRQFIAFVPVIGWMWFLNECGFLKGNPDSNLYDYHNVKEILRMYDQNTSRPLGKCDSLKNKKMSNK